MIKRLIKWFRGDSVSVSHEPLHQLNKLEKKLGFSIPHCHLTLFKRALRHRSTVDNDRFNSFETYERLEFLGDAVLDLIVTEILFEKFPTENEGFLTKLRAKLVRADTLFDLAINLELNKFLEIGDRAAGQGIETSKSVLSDVYEALIAAIYVSMGYPKAYQFVKDNLTQYIDIDVAMTKIDNYKSLLMEFSQSEKLELPRYEVLSEDGPGHDKTFNVAVFIGDQICGEGTGKSKKNAEQFAAKEALKKLKI